MTIASYAVTVYYETKGGDLKDFSYQGAFADMKTATDWVRAKVENDKRRRCRRIYRTTTSLIHRF